MTRTELIADLQAAGWTYTNSRFLGVRRAKLTNSDDREIEWLIGDNDSAPVYCSEVVGGQRERPPAKTVDEMRTWARAPRGERP